MDYARLLGEMRPRRDPGVRQHEEAHQPPPESECIPFAVAGEKVFRHTVSHRFLMWGIYFKQIAIVMVTRNPGLLKSRGFYITAISLDIIHKLDRPCHNSDYIAL